MNDELYTFTLGNELPFRSGGLRLFAMTLELCVFNLGTRREGESKP